VSDAGPRRRARERALEIAYEAAIKQRSLSTVLGELNTRPDDYTIALLASAEVHESEVDELIAAYAIDWPLERLALVDRLIMSLAVGEMLMENAPPIAVILNEAVELAKIFSTEGSSSFVNGVLSSIAQRVLG